jgi:cell wall-associated NlpC family hydrolase
MKQNKLLYTLIGLARQKFTWFAVVMVALTVMAFRTRPDDIPNNNYTALSASEINQQAEIAATVERSEEVAYLDRKSPEPMAQDYSKTKLTVATLSGKHTKIVDYAMSLMGTPYRFGGKSTKGFDCSGFVYHVFKENGFNIERSSRAQSTQGTDINTDEVQPGDLLFFTGTKPEIRKVGHVGIVISEPGEPVQFVHSSSNGGVKVSELEGYYSTRFMWAKRM